MFDLSFSFAAALWALPLAGMPVLLHLLFKQKSPVVPFSTLRFIKLSVQKTAARRRVHKWLLLACRALLIALLIWAIAQPVHQFTSSWLGGGRSIAAAIVVDTSYSMQLQDGQVTLLAKADAMVQDLLRDQLAGAKVSLFKSQAMSVDHPEQLQDASALLAEWSPFKPQASSKPLVDRVAAAINMLDHQPADQKWLVVLSDFQSQEFPHPMPELKGGRTVLLDLHATHPRSAGTTRIAINPTQAIPGIPSEVSVEVSGQPSDARAITLKIENADAKPIFQSAPVMATMDSGGRATSKFQVKLPAERWVLFTASLTADDAMNWDNQRSELIEVPPKQRVGLMQQGNITTSQRMLTLALDPSEGSLAEWPLAVSKINPPNVQQDVIVASLSRWPTPQQANEMLNFARGGRTIILFLSPSLGSSWALLPQAEQDALGELLPSPPIERPGNSLCRLAVANAADPLLAGLTDEKYQLNAITVRQMVSLTAEGNSSAILNAIPVDPLPDSRAQGFLFRNPIGRGVCYTCATIADSQVTNLATHPTFLPLLVRMALKTSEQSAAQNVELGQPLVLDGSRAPDQPELQIEGPQHEQYRVPATTEGDRQFAFNDADAPGLYRWQTVNDASTIAITNVQLPASESDLTYRPADTVAPPGSNTIIAKDVKELSTKVASLTAPQPKWSIPLALVMFLLCVEALLGSWSKSKKSSGLRVSLPVSQTTSG